MLLEIFLIILLAAGVLIFLMNKRENPPVEEEILPDILLLSPGEVSGDIENIMDELGIQRAVFVLDGQPYMGDYVTPLLVNVKEYSPYL